jgi:hypothetical protein
MVCPANVTPLCRRHAGMWAYTPPHCHPHLQDLCASWRVRQWHVDDSVKAPWTNQRRVDSARPVGCAQHDQTSVVLKSIHLCATKGRSNGELCSGAMHHSMCMSCFCWQLRCPLMPIAPPNMLHAVVSRCLLPFAALAWHQTATKIGDFKNCHD